MAKKTSSAPARPHVPIEVELTNFGPISRGKFTIKPLTIFVGPNNSGKTYAAMLAHSILSSGTQSPILWESADWVHKQSKNKQFQKLVALMGKMVASAVGSSVFYDVPIDYSNKIHDLALKRAFGDNLFKTLNANFSSALSDLVRIGSVSSNIKITHPIGVNISIFKTKSPIIKFSPHNDRYVIQNVPGSLPIAEPHDHNDTSKKHTGMLNQLVYDDMRFFSSTLSLDKKPGLHALLSLMSRMSHSFISSLHRSYYIPAARAGILSSYSNIVSSIINNAKHGAITPFDGVVSDFIESLVGMSGNHDLDTSQSEHTMINEMFGGQIYVTKPDVGIPQIFFKFMGKSIPINRSSSGITETAPIQLFIQKQIRRSDLLIIEEPEAHLHPANQTKLAKYIVRLVNSGVYVLLITHSVFFLEQLSMFVKMNKLKPAQRKKLGYGLHDYIVDDCVAPYVFKPDSSGSYTIGEIEHSDEYGIAQDEFNRVTEIMYEEDLAIDNYLEK